MNEIIQKLLDCGKDCYRMKGKRVIVTDDIGVTRRIPYEDFFKVKIYKTEDNMLSISFNDKDGVDMLSFMSIGMCLNLSSLGLYIHSGDYDFNPTEYLTELASFVSKDYKIVNDISDFNKTSSKIDDIFLYGASSKTLRSVKDKAKKEEYKSLYFSSLFGSSTLRPDTNILSDIVPFIVCMSISDEGRKKLVEAFCRYSSLVAFAGTQIFSYYDRRNGDDKGGDIIDSFIDSVFFDTNRLNFDYSKVKFNDKLVVSDINGVSMLISYLYANVLFFGNGRDNSFLSDNIPNFTSCFNGLVGNDFTRDYLLKGNINKLITALYKNTEYVYNYEDAEYPVISSNLFVSATFYKDISKYGISLKNLEGVGVLGDNYARYKDCHFSLSLSGGYDLIYNFADNLKSIAKECTTKVAYYKNRNSFLAEKNKSLTKEIKDLNSNIDGLKEYSTSVKEEDYSNLKSDYDLALSKIAMLEEKCSKLDTKCSELQGDMDSLLDSLEADDDGSSSEISMEEMIDFLNGFNLSIVGGRYDMGDKLKEMGLHNFTQYVTVNEIGRMKDFDFMISMTRFMSHPMFYSAMSKLGSERDKHFYFNGTNLENMISSCYEFVNKYFEIS